MEELTPNIDLVSALMLFSILQGSALFYFFVSRPPLHKNRYLAASLFSLLLITLEAFLNRSGYMAYTLHFLNVTVPFLFLLGPLIYFYTFKSIGGKASFSIQWPHYLPFGLYLLYSIFFFVQPASVKYNAFVKSFQPDWPLVEATKVIPLDPLDIQGFVVVEGIVIHLIVYMAWGLYKTIRFKAGSKDDVNINWLRLLNGFGLIAGIVLFLAEGGVVNGRVLLQTPLPDFSSSVFSAFMTYALSLFLISDADFFREKKGKYRNSTLSPSLRKKYLQRIETIMEKEKIFLRQSFSMAELSKQTGLKSHHISQILNEELNLSFFELTHDYRIREARRLIKESDDQIKIEPLAYQLGYRSKSAFYKAFKKHTEMTPAQYRRQINISDSI